MNVLTRQSVEEKILNYTVASRSINVTWQKYLMIDGNVWAEGWRLMRDIMFMLTDPNAFQPRLCDS